MYMRFGLLGTGYWAEQTHGATLAAHPQVEFVGVWGRDPAKAAGVAGRFGVRAYPDVTALFQDVDAVAVALPPDVQAELAVQAAEAGCHLLLEKPLACTVEAADQIVGAVDKGGLSALVFFTNRFFPNVEEFLVSAAETGRHGGWDGARATMFASIFQPGNPYGASPWRRDRGGLWDIGPHALSTILPVLGPVSSVCAVGGPHGTCHLLLTHVSGAVSTVALTLDAPQAMVMSEFAFYGRSGTVLRPSPEGRSVDAFGEAVSQLIADVAAGRPGHSCDVRFARDVTAVLCAAQEAMRTGEHVTPALGPDAG